MASSSPKKIGFIGLGAMGSPMALNVAKMLEFASVFVFDVNESAVSRLLEQGEDAGLQNPIQKAASPRELGKLCDVVVTMVPNDKILRLVCLDSKTGLLGSTDAESEGSERQLFTGVHISCSTVHPETSRELAKIHQEMSGAAYVGAPVFARADGVAHRQASIVVGGAPEAVEIAQPILDAMALQVFQFGDDPGAGNVVKLCGNYMIAAAIESSAEALSLAECSGLDRVAVMEMLTSTIFDCLIYKGYGMRTAHRQHLSNQPMVGPGFQLELGLKDMTLVRDVAHQVGAPMPFGSILHDRFVACQNKYCKEKAAEKEDDKHSGTPKTFLDWSALSLLASEEAGVDVSPWLPGGNKVAEQGDSIAPM